MIADLDAERCTACGVCVSVCPADVFAPTTERPYIARPDACQTCFLCELYCPADALYVDPDCEVRRPVDVGTLNQSRMRGKFRRDSGWGESEVPNLHWRMDEIFGRAFALAQASAKK